MTVIIVLPGGEGEVAIGDAVKVNPVSIAKSVQNTTEIVKTVSNGVEIVKTVDNITEIS